jgi:hypothetical protein
LFFDVDPGGRYFIVGEKPNRTWLGRVQSPESKVIIAEDFLASDVFAIGDRIYVTGFGYTPDSSGRTNELATCLILNEVGETFQIVERLDFDWASGVVEVDPLGSRLLLWDKALISHSVYSYDLVAKQRSKIGRVKGFQFFLFSDLLK